jgi:hypothetical protein
VLTGNIIVDGVSGADIQLFASGTAPSTLTGAINNPNTGKTVKVTMDAASRWIVTGTSYLTTLTDADATHGNISCQTAGCRVYVGGNLISIQ